MSNGNVTVLIPYELILFEFTLECFFQPMMPSFAR